MKTFATLLMVLFAVVGCGGNVLDNGATTESEITPPGQDPAVQPYRCGDWTRDEAFSELMIGGIAVDTANGSNVSSDLLITVSSGANHALAKRTASSWEVQSLPANVYQAQKLCTLPSGTTFLSVIDMNGVPTLLANEGTSWSTELQLTQLAQIVNVWAANGAVLLSGLGKDGATVVISNESSAWQSETLPDLSIPYFLYRFYNVRSDYFALGFFDFEKGANQHALLLHRYAGESSWKKVELPSQVYLIGEMFGYSKDALFLAGQTDQKSAVLYKASGGLANWETYAADDNLFAFTNVWQHANGAVIVAGQSDNHSGPNGSYVQLTGKDFYEDDSFPQHIDNSAGYPHETWYDESTKNLYLLTSRDLYYRHCP